MGQSKPLDQARALGEPDLRLTLADLPSLRFPTVWAINTCRDIGRELMAALAAVESSILGRRWLVVNLDRLVEGAWPHRTSAACLARRVGLSAHSSTSNNGQCVKKLHLNLYSCPRADVISTTDRDW